MSGRWMIITIVEISGAGQVLKKKRIERRRDYSYRRNIRGRTGFEKRNDRGLLTIVIIEMSEAEEVLKKKRDYHLVVKDVIRIEQFT